MAGWGAAVTQGRISSSCYQENSTENLPLNGLPAGSSFELEICSVQLLGGEGRWL